MRISHPSLAHHPVDWIHFTLTPKTESFGNVGTIGTPEHLAAARDLYYPAWQIVKPSPSADTLARETYLGSYAANGASWRAFCTRCGTGLTFYYAGDDASGADADAAAVTDVALGTLAPECLAKPWVRPQRHCHWDSGTPWVREMLYRGTGPIPRHPGGLPTALVDDDSWMLPPQQGSSTQ